MRRAAFPNIESIHRRCVKSELNRVHKNAAASDAREGYRRMIELGPARRSGTPDEVGNVGAVLMGADGAFITGSDFLMDGGVTAAYWYGELAPK